MRESNKRSLSILYCEAKAAHVVFSSLIQWNYLQGNEKNVYLLSKRNASCTLQINYSRLLAFFYSNFSISQLKVDFTKEARAGKFSNNQRKHKTQFD